MAGQKQHGGDWFDKLQAHNRNVLLKEQADAAKETAKQAKLDREQNEEHRILMRKIAQKEAADKAALLQLTREEHENKEKAKNANSRIHALSRKLKDIKKATTPGQKFSIIFELQKESESIDIDSVLDLEYKDRFCDTRDELERALSDLFDECGENAIYLKTFIKINKRGFDTPINVLSEISNAEKIEKIESIFPELSCPGLTSYKNNIDVFLKKAIKIKSIFEVLKTKISPVYHDKLKVFFAKYLAVSESIFTEKSYYRLEISPLSEEDFSVIEKLNKNLIADESIPSEDLQPLFDFFSEATASEKIDVDSFRLKGKREEIVRLIADIANVKAIEETKKEKAKKDKVKTGWQSVGGCGCLTIIIGCCFPPAIPFLVLCFIGFLIGAIVNSCKAYAKKKQLSNEKT